MRNSEMKHWRLIVFFVCLPLIVGCGFRTAETQQAFNKTVYRPGYAADFQIKGADGCESTLIHVYNPWQGAHDVEMSYFIRRNGEKVPDGFSGQVIKGDARRIVCMSSSYIAMLGALGKVNRVVGVSGLEYVSNRYVNEHRDVIKDVGPEMNYEVLLTLKPDVVLLYGIGDAQTTITGKLRELNIPYMYMGEYLEESPLGKAEWMVVLSEITGCREEGMRLFTEVAGSYNRTRKQVAGVSYRPRVMFNVPWNDAWIVPSSQSYMARLVADAGGDYVCRKSETNALVTIGMETAYGLMKETDYWLNVGMCTTLAELCAMNPKFAEAKAVRKGNVYNNNLRTTAGGGNDFWESAVVKPDVVLRDLIRIFHPELDKGALYYYRHLN